MKIEKKKKKIAILECIWCKKNPLSLTISRYYIKKNKRNIKLSFLKYCKFCINHTLHKELV